MAGYLLESFPDARHLVRPTLERLSTIRPEVAIVWNSFVPPGDFSSRVGGAATHVLEMDAPSLNEGLDQFRDLVAMHPVVERAERNAALPTSLVEVARLMQSGSQHLVIADQAVKRAKESPFETPENVLDALVTLDGIAGEYAAGLIGDTLQEVCDERGIFYSPDISSTARQKHSRLYEVEYEGQRRPMGPHLRFGGSWNPRHCARVYWWKDPVSRKFVIGHIGVHLPGGDE